MIDLKVALYSRVSTQDQEVYKQEEEMVKFCENRSYIVVEKYRDVISGTKDSRPALNDLMQSAYKKDFDAVVIWKLDRLGRSLKHLLDVTNKFEHWGIGIVCVTQPLDTTSPGGKLLFQIMGAMAEFERNLISERTRTGLKYAKNVGKRGRDKKPRKWRVDKGKKRGGLKSGDF